MVRLNSHAPGALAALTAVVGLSLVSGAAGQCRYGSGFTGEVELDSEVEFWLEWRVDGGDVVIGLSANDTVGFLGFGLGEVTSGSMVGADIVTAFISDGSLVVEDRFVPWAAFPFSSNDPLSTDRSADDYFNYEEATNVDIGASLYPELDGVNDWTAVDSEEADGCVRMTMRRAAVSSDLNDRDFTLGSVQPVLWAFGASNAVEYHHANRGTVGIDFSSDGADVTEATCPDCVVLNLTMNEAAVPAQETSYFCQAFDMTALTGGVDMHAIAVYPDIDTAYVHHILVHDCTNDAGFASLTVPDFCGGAGGSGKGNSPLAGSCRSLLFGWAPGTGSLVLPAEAGFLLGSTGSIAASTIVVEIHYNNPAQDTGALDSTTIRMIATPTLRTHNAGVLSTGDPLTSMRTIPASSTGVVHRQGVCASDCTAKLGGQSLTGFASFLHMHSHGKAMKSNLYDSSMNFKGTVDQIDFWNFEFQRGTEIDVTIAPGDNIFVHCEYDTSKWEWDVGAGIDSLQEMCMHFISYYPVVEVDGAPFTICGGSASYDTFRNIINGEFPGAGSLLDANALPSWNGRMFSRVCSIDDLFDADNDYEYSERVLGFDVPVQRLDPLEYDSVAGDWRPITSGFGTGEANVGGGGGGGDGDSRNSDDPNYDFMGFPFGGDAFKMYWRIQTESCELSLRVSVAGDVWVSVGLGTGMVGGKAVIADGGGVEEYSLTSKQTSGLDFEGAADGIVAATWTLVEGRRELEMNVTSIAGTEVNIGCSARRQLMGADAADLTDDVIVAYGASILTNAKHAERALFAINWNDTLSSGLLEPTEGAIEAHAYLMSVAFGLCMPLLIAFPVTRKPAASPSAWFAAHRGTAGFALLLVLGGLALAVSSIEDGEHLSDPHHLVGVVVVALVVMNPLLGVLRPAKESANRQLWLVAHRIVGYGSVLLGLFNCVLGAKLLEDAEGFAGESSVAVAAVFVAVGVIILGGANFARPADAGAQGEHVAKVISL